MLGGPGIFCSLTTTNVARDSGRAARRYRRLLNSLQRNEQVPAAGGEDSHLQYAQPGDRAGNCEGGPRRKDHELHAGGHPDPSYYTKAFPQNVGHEGLAGEVAWDTCAMSMSVKVNQNCSEFGQGSSRGEKLPGAARGPMQDHDRRPVATGIDSVNPLFRCNVYNEASGRVHVGVYPLTVVSLASNRTTASITSAAVPAERSGAAISRGHSLPRETQPVLRPAAPPPKMSAAG
jgi:hypothetical protein